MFSKQSHLFAMVILVGLGTLAYTASNAQDQQPQQQPETRWEYKAKMNASTADLNSFGEDGWELVTVAYRGSDQLNQNFYFKRPKHTPIAIVEPQHHDHASDH